MTYCKCKDLRFAVTASISCLKTTWQDVDTGSEAFPVSFYLFNFFNLSCVISF